MTVATWTLRQASWDDLEGVTAMLHASEAVMPAFGFEPHRLVAEWQRDGFDIARDGWVAVAPDGQIVGECDSYRETPDRIYTSLDVHPAWLGRGIEAALLAQGEAHARTLLADTPQRLHWLSSLHTHPTLPAVYSAHGYQIIRHFWRMEIDLDETPPPVAPLSDGLTLRTFADTPDAAERIHHTVETGFAEHFGHTDETFAEWRQFTMDFDGFDPTLWHVVWSGDEIVGVSLNRWRAGKAWIGQLAVLKPWRGHGVGTALLTHSFADFWRRGARTVGLGVDAANTTGATRLYERAGMHVAIQEDLWEKVL